MNEKIILLEDWIKTPMKWARIARHLGDRNQHQVKNKFYSILYKETDSANKELAGNEVKSKKTMREKVERFLEEFKKERKKNFHIPENSDSYKKNSLFDGAEEIVENE